MNSNERKAMEAAGYVFEDAEDFLELTAEERLLVELRLAVSRAIRAHREAQNLTQIQAAKKLTTSQPRIANIEAGGQGASLDSMFRALFALGGTMKDIGFRQIPRRHSAAGRDQPVNISSAAKASVSRQAVTKTDAATTKRRRRLCPT